MANNIIRRTWKQGGMVNIEDLRGSAFQAEDGGHTFMISGVDENGDALALSGTPAGVLLRADGQDVTLTCSVSDGVVSATLPANAYVVPGRIGITIFLTNGGQKTAIYAAIAAVATTSSGTVAPPAGADVVTLVNAIETAISQIPASDTNLKGALAPTYSTSAVYAVGSYAWYDGKLYKCTTAITSGETWTSSHWTEAKLANDVTDLKSALTKDEQTLFALAQTFEMLSADNFVKTCRYSSSSLTLVTSNNTAYGTTGLIRVKPGKTYCLSGDVFNNPPLGCYMAEGAEAVVGQAYSSAIAFTKINDTAFYFTVPSGVAYVLIDVRYTDNNKTTLNNTGKFHLVPGSSPVENVAYNERFVSDSLLLKGQNIEDNAVGGNKLVDQSVTPIKASFFDATSHNLINPANLTETLYYSTTNVKLSTSDDTHANGLTGLIPVTPGKKYTYSGTGMRTSGGYFGEGAIAQSGQTAISSVDFLTPVTGSGYYFTVPEDNRIKYVALNVVKNSTTHEIDTNIQLEFGEMATPVQPYQLVYKIKEEYIPDNGGGSGASGIDVLPMPSYAFEYEKISNFISHQITKDKDIVVAGTGTSLTARSSEYCSVRDDATSRPPLLHSNNFASKIWDRIVWEGQEYRRFDYTGFFTETGTWASAHDLEDWDDGNGDYRYGITRYASGSASVAFAVPTGAWQFNFIYRTDTSGSEEVTVTITEGNGKMEVWNGSEWVEANGYQFSMRESVINLSNVQVCQPNTTNNAKTTIATYQVGGNTTYQKRLKMRCKSGTIDSRENTKTVTISSSTGRLMYWGVEWSPREYMITYINAARGSHNMSYSSDLSLSHFQDNEIWSFKPDLIFTENPIHNSGAAGSSFSSYYTTYWGYSVYDFFFNTDNPISMAARAAANGVTGLEWIVFSSSITDNFGGIDANGKLIVSADKNGKMITALDAQSMAIKWIMDNEEDVIAINACKYWCDAGRKLFDGNLKDATSGSGSTGSTFSNEGSHWNDMGCSVMDRCIGPVFDFYN